MKVLTAVVALLCVVSLIAMWVCGTGLSVSLIALILKWCGVTFVSTMSAWLPMKFLGGWVVSAVVASLSGGYLTYTKGK